MIIAGGEGKLGAGIFAARAFLRSGAGLLTMSVPESGITVLQTSVPEAMVIPYNELNPATENLSKYESLGIGPGIGTSEFVINLFDQLLNTYKKPMVWMQML
jgi:NAD(P)H-hydrate epimerase